MDPDRFDAFSRTLATRRGLLTRIGLGSLAALLATRALTVDAADPVTCILAVRLAVRVGPSADRLLGPGASSPGALTGSLTLPLSKKGAVTAGTLPLPDETVATVIGEAVGHRVDVRVALPDGRALVLSGVGERPLTKCTGRVDGVLIGPEDGDLGDWHATGSGAVAVEAAATLTAPAAETTRAAGSSATSSAPSDDRCADGLTFCDGTCIDTREDIANCHGCGVVCPAPPLGGSMRCDPDGCRGVCLVNSADCGANTCVDLVNDPANCGGCGNVCSAPAGVSVSCANGTCSYGCEPGRRLCPDGCVDPAGDPLNCGDCARVCASRSCTAGVCDCVGDHEPCGIDADCCGGHCCDGSCVDVATDLENCLDCGTVCTAPPGATPICAGGCNWSCNPGVNVVACGDGCHELDSDPFNCGSCGNVCASRSCTGGSCDCVFAHEPCAIDGDCCSGRCGDDATCQS